MGLQRKGEHPGPARCSMPLSDPSLPQPTNQSLPCRGTRARRAVEAARKSLYAILGTLWPEDWVAGPAPSLDALMAPWNVSSLTDDMDACYEEESKPGSAIAQQLAALGVASSMPNKVGAAQLKGRRAGGARAAYCAAGLTHRRGQSKRLAGACGRAGCCQQLACG